MKISDFIEMHRDELAKDEIRFNLVLNIMSHAMNDQAIKVRLWSLDAAGACAIQQAGYGIALGKLTKADAIRLADSIGSYTFPSVIGTDQSADWFVEAAKLNGHYFPKVRNETVHLLDHQPTGFDVAGDPRKATPSDIELVHSWLNAFGNEALPNGQPVEREDALARINKGAVFLWCLRNEPVAMSCVARVLSSGVSIGSVYTTPNERCRGFAGAITAHVVRQILDKNFSYAFLYTDDTNPAAGRCYAKIGFQSYCKSSHYTDVSRP